MRWTRNPISDQNAGDPWFQEELAAIGCVVLGGHLSLGSRFHLDADRRVSRALNVSTPVVL